MRAKLTVNGSRSWDSWQPEPSDEQHEACRHECDNCIEPNVCTSDPFLVKPLEQTEKQEDKDENKEEEAPRADVVNWEIHGKRSWCKIVTPTIPMMRSSKKLTMICDRSNLFR
jgi:hypothetical protein